jgi:hypothetical protein
VAVAVIAVQAVSPLPALAAGTPAYNSVPATLAGNYPSQPYQAQQTNEFGDLVHLAGTNRVLEDVTIGFSSWACETGNWFDGDCVTTPGATFDHPITVNIYAAGAPVPGALLASVTETVNAPFRPSSDPDCEGGRWQNGPLDTDPCFNGFAFTHVFDMSAGDVVLPDDVIVTVAYNTQSWGESPIGADGPYNSLNVALLESTPPTVGTDVDPDVVYWNTETAANYTDGGAGGVGILRTDTDWTPYSLMVAINTSAPLAAAPGPLGGVTGSDVTWYVAGGAALVLVGVVAVLITRRPRRTV